MTGEKLQKVIAATGLGSSRQVERWIGEGRVRVDGEIAHLGHRVDSRASITVDGRAVARDEIGGSRVILYHKPLGEICTRSDPGGRPTVFDRLPDVSGRWVSVGRLDINSSGLLLLTNDGQLASHLMHPSSGFEREYIARVRGRPGAGDLNRLKKGVLIDGRPARFETLEPFGRKQSASNQWYRVTLSEGRNREVRRLWEQVGCTVNQLKRTRFGPVPLPRDLPPGRWRELDAARVRALRESVAPGTSA